MNEEIDINIETPDETLEKLLEFIQARESENAAEEENSKILKENDSKAKQFRLPFARIKHIMKADPDCTLVSLDAVAIVTKATEMFIEFLGKEAVKHTSKRKTLMKRDVDTVIELLPQLCFLEGALEWD